MSQSVHQFANQLAESLPSGTLTSEQRIDQAVNGFSNYMNGAILLELAGLVTAEENYERFITVIAAYSNTLTKYEFMEFVERFDQRTLNDLDEAFAVQEGAY